MKNKVRKILMILSCLISLSFYIICTESLSAALGIYS